MEREKVIELNNINLTNMTDKIVLSMSGTEDESLCGNDSAFKVEKGNNNDDREENEHLYEEYSKWFDITKSNKFLRMKAALFCFFCCDILYLELFTRSLSLMYY